MEYLKQISLTTMIMIFIELMGGLLLRALGFEFWDYSGRDRKSVVQGKSVDLGGRRIMKQVQ